MYNPIKEKLQNSLISFDWIEKHPWDYQALFEQLADYLLENSDSKWWTETEKGILFFDNIKKMMDLTVKLRCIISDHRVLKLYLTMFMNAG